MIRRKVQAKLLDLARVFRAVTVTSGQTVVLEHFRGLARVAVTAGGATRAFERLRVHGRAAARSFQGARAVPWSRGSDPRWA